MSDHSVGSDDSLLGVPESAVAALESEARAGSLRASSIARLPKFLRTFYLRFLKEVLNIQIRRFTVEEGNRISDRLVDLEASGAHSSTWPLLSDFVDLCRYFDDFGLMSVPEAAQEHEAEIFELTARILYDLGTWAGDEGFDSLHHKSRDLSAKLESIGSGVRAG